MNKKIILIIKATGVRIIRYLHVPSNNVIYSYIETLVDVWQNSKLRGNTITLWTRVPTLISHSPKLLVFPYSI